MGTAKAVMGGGMSSTQLTVTTTSTVTNVKQFRTDLASALGIAANWTFVPNPPSGTSVIVEVIGPTPTALASLPTPLTLTSATVTSIAQKMMPRTNECYGSKPRSATPPCLGPDPATTRWPASRKQMSGVKSCTGGLTPEHFAPQC